MSQESPGGAKGSGDLTTEGKVALRATKARGWARREKALSNEVHAKARLRVLAMCTWHPARIDSRKYTGVRRSWRGCRGAEGRHS